MKKIIIYGSTGSVGQQMLELITASNKKNPTYEVLGLIAGGTRQELLNEQKIQHKSQYALIATELNSSNLDELLDQCTHVLVCSSRLSGLDITLKALTKNKQVVLANKETLVAGGKLINAHPHRANLRLADSEHAAIEQCLQGIDKKHIKNIYITASGGPFLNNIYTKEILATVSPAMALKHPTWSMGPKITLDSATLMNKSLEVIEANMYFGIPYEQIKILIHPQSLVHGLVELNDGNIIAQFGPNSMHLTLQWAFEGESHRDIIHKGLELGRLGNFSFEEADAERFPCVTLGHEIGKLNDDSKKINMLAADEIAIESFLAGKLNFTDIYKLIRTSLDEHELEKINNADDIKRVFESSLELARKIIQIN